MSDTTRDAPATNRLPVFALLGANAISVIGSMLTLVALPWYVLEATGSAAKTGLTGTFLALPAFVAGVFGGTIVDRLGYKRASVIADLVSGLGIMMIPLLHDTIGLAYWQLLMFVFLGALLDIPGLTGRRSMLPELAKMAGLRLEQVNAGFESIQSLALLVGPPLAGLLIGLIGAANVLWLDAVSFFVSALIVALAVPALRPREAKVASGRYVEELRAGLRFLYRDRVLLALAISLALTNFLNGPLFAVILPVYIKDVFGSAAVLGTVAAVFGAGALTGALGYGAIGHRLPRRALWLTGFMLAALPLWVILLTRDLSWLLAVAFVTGLATGPINPLLVTIRHERIPIDLRGRVFATFSAISAVATPVGMVVAGVAIQGLGLSTMLLGLAVLTQAVGLGMFFVAPFRQMGQPSPAAVPVQEGAG